MKKIALLLVIIFVIGGVFLFKDKLAYFGKKLPSIEALVTEPIIKEIKKEILAPAPLRAKVEAPQSFLTEAGVIQWTNVQRIQNNLETLRVNAKLAEAASLKIEDMFKGQYFAHESPAGFGPSHWVERAGYEFIAIGENLALGNFKNDEDLVRGWMNSPGHRANILNVRFTEIGVAVKRGTFEGRTTWLAVQVFARPLLNCPKPEDAVRIQIENAERALETLGTTLAAKRAEIEAMNPKRDRDEYNQKVAEYNALIQEYNKMVEAVKNLIANYNNQVRNFNECLKQ